VSDPAPGAADPAPQARRRFAPGTTADDLKAYMAPFVTRLGFKFNTDEGFVEQLLSTEIGILDEAGDVYCPCRLRSGDPKKDAEIVCPCIAVNLREFSARKKCWCGLFIRADVADGASLHGVITAAEGAVEVRVAAFDDLCDAQVRHLKVGKRDIALARVGGEYFALSNVCRHAFGQLADGYMEGYALMCPLHGWRYDVRDGTTDHPGADVRTYPVTVRAGEVFITLDA